MRKLALVVSAAVVMSASATAASASTAPTQVSAHLSRYSVNVGTRVYVNGTISPGTHRPVTVQRYYAGAWHKVATGKTGRLKHYQVALPKRPRGEYSYRVVATRTKSYGPKTSVRRHLFVSGITEVNVNPLPSPVKKGASSRLTGAVSGTAPLKRPIQLQRKLGSSWFTLTEKKSSTRGAFSFPLPTTKIGTATYRINVPRAYLATRTVSAARTLIVSPVGPFVLAPDAYTGTIKAVSLTGGSKIVYRPGAEHYLYEDDLDATPAGQIAAVEWSNSADLPQVWLGGTMARQRVYQSSYGRCPAWVDLAPDAHSVVVVEGYEINHGYDCYPDTLKLVNPTAAINKQLVPKDDENGYVWAFNPAGTTLAVARTDLSGPIQLFDTRTAARLADVPGTQNALVHDLWWTSRGLVYAGTQYDLYSTGNGTIQRIMTDLPTSVRSATISADGSSLGWEDGGRRIYRSPMSYTQSGPLTTDLVGYGYDPDSDRLEFIQNKYLAVHDEFGGGKVQDMNGSTVWHGASLAGWIN